METKILTILVFVECGYHSMEELKKCFYSEIICSINTSQVLAQKTGYGIKKTVTCSLQSHLTGQRAKKLACLWMLRCYKLIA